MSDLVEMDDLQEPCYIIEDDDYVIDSDTGCLSTAYNVDGLGLFDSFDDAVRAIVDDMNTCGFYPNVWHVNDHGNTDLLSINTYTLETEIVESWI